MIVIDTYYLCLNESNSQPKLLLVTDQSEIDDESRNSPVFPVLPDDFKVLNPSGTVYYLFFFCSNTYEVISKLTPHIKQLSLFSHGLASLIVPLKDKSEIESIKTAVRNYNAVETWVVSDGIIKNRQIDCDNVIPDVLFENPLEIKGILVKDSLNIAADIKKHMSKLVRGAYLYCPELVEIVHDVIPFIQYTINVFIENHSKLAKFEATINDDSKTSDENNFKRFLYQSRIDQSSDLLVQLRSSLAYIYSQIFYGTPPIEKNECLLAGYSLLGIGSAVIALFSLTRFIEKTFENYRIPKVIQDRYSMLDYLSSKDALNSESINSKYSIEEYIKRYSSESVKPSLTFFSTRIGYKETKMTVTAATQTLEAAYSVRWTPFTITHELMHSHVRVLLSVIFSPSKLTTEESCSSYMMEKYNGYLSSKKRKLYESATKKLNFINTIQYIIFDFLVEWGQCPSIEELAISDVDLDIKAEDSIAWLKNNFANQYKILNEIIVHTLDYYYFYNSNEVLFLGSLWGSWTTVPGVSKHISEYILRSIVAISINHDGDEMARFNSAVAQLEGVLEKLCQNKDSKTLAMMALSFLGDKKDRLRKLKLKFAICDTIARLTHKYFTCESLLAGIEDSDSRITVDDDGNHKYDLDSGLFLGNINNPVVLSKVLLARSIENLINSEERFRSEDFLSAWHLVAVASGISETKTVMRNPSV